MHYYLILLLGLSFSLQSCAQTSNDMNNKEPLPEGMEKVKKSEDEWRKELTEQEFYILREKGTERAGTGELLNNKKKGMYCCAGCDLALFPSTTKFKSGTGWPSFYDVYKEKHVAEEVDNSFGMARTEVLCNRCNGHLGHVFEDGPKPTGLRYCLNSAALDFRPLTEEEKEELKKQD